MLIYGICMHAGLDLDPSNEGLKKALQEAEAAGKKSPMAGLFGPQFMAKLATNPKTRAYLSQPDFMQMIQVRMHAALLEPS